MAITRGEIKTRAKQRAEKENDNHVGDEEWNDYINESYQELWDIVVDAYAHHFATSTDFTLSGSTYTQALPADFYELQSLDRDPDTRHRYDVPSFLWEERNTTGQVSYRIRGNLLVIEPRERAAGTYRLWYTPGAAELTADTGASGTLDAAVERWAEYVTVGAAMKALAKEESDTTHLERRLALIEARIRRRAKNRGQVKRVVDIYQERMELRDLPRP